jgi:hypothetical protein
MTPSRTLPLLAAALIALAACGLGARDVDYSRDRGISDDISATHDRGPTPLRPGEAQRDEPLGAYPSTLDVRHQPGR